MHDMALRSLWSDRSSMRSMTEMLAWVNAMPPPMLDTSNVAKLLPLPCASPSHPSSTPFPSTYTRSLQLKHHPRNGSSEERAQERGEYVPTIAASWMRCRLRRMVSRWTLCASWTIPCFAVLRVAIPPHDARSSVSYSKGKEVDAHLTAPFVLSHMFLLNPPCARGLFCGSRADSGFNAWLYVTCTNFGS